MLPLPLPLPLLLAAAATAAEATQAVVAPVPPTGDAAVAAAASDDRAMAVGRLCTPPLLLVVKAMARVDQAARASGRGVRCAALALRSQCRRRRLCVGPCEPGPAAVTLLQAAVTTVSQMDRLDRIDPSVRLVVAEPSSAIAVAFRFRKRKTKKRKKEKKRKKKSRADR